jgi:hypothetical protein
LNCFDDPEPLVLTQELMRRVGMALARETWHLEALGGARERCGYLLLAEKVLQAATTFGGGGTEALRRTERGQMDGPGRELAVRRAAERETLNAFDRRYWETRGGRPSAESLEELRAQDAECRAAFEAQSQ